MKQKICDDLNRHKKIVDNSIPINDKNSQQTRNIKEVSQHGKRHL